MGVRFFSPYRICESYKAAYSVSDVCCFAPVLIVMDRDDRYGQCAGTKGGPTPTRVALPTRAAAVAAGLRHSVVLDVNGRVWTFGSNRYGQLNRDVASPQDPEPTLAFTAEVVSSIQSGWSHIAALTGTYERKEAHAGNSRCR